MLRRLLLLMITALVVARPLVNGEDPGLLETTSNGSTLLGLLWLVGGACWAAWRYVARRGEWYLGIVEAALGIAVALFFCSAEMAANRHPARLIAWEWLILLVAFVMVRHLAATPDARHGLFAVFLATGVMLAAHGDYQAVAQWLANGRIATPVHATFGSSSLFSGSLLLMLPGLFGACIVCMRNRAGRGRTHFVFLLFLAAVVAWCASWSGFSSHLGTWHATWKIIAAHPWLGVGGGNFGYYLPRFMNAGTPEMPGDPHNFLLELWATGGVFLLIAMLTAFAAFGWYVWRATPGTEPLPAPRLPGSDGTTPETPVRWEYYVGGVLGLLLGFAIRITALTSPEQILNEGIIAAVRSLVWFVAFAVFEGVRWSDRQRALALAAGVAAVLLNLLVSGGIGVTSIAGPLFFALALGLASLSLAPRVFPGAPFPNLVLPIVVMWLPVFIYMTGWFYPVSSSMSMLREGERSEQGLRNQSNVATAGFASLFLTAELAPNSGPFLGATQAFLFAEYERRVVSSYRDTALHHFILAARADEENPRLFTRCGVALHEYWQHLARFGPPDRARNPAAWREARKKAMDQASEGAFINLHAAQRMNPQAIEPILSEVDYCESLAREQDGAAAQYCQRADAVNTESNATTERKNLEIKLWRREAASADLWATQYRENTAKLLTRAMTLDPTRPALQFHLAEVMDQLAHRSRAGMGVWQLLAESIWSAEYEQKCQDAAEEALRLDADAKWPPRRLSLRQRLWATAWADRDQ